MTPCEERGYKEGQIFKITRTCLFTEGSIVALSKDDGSYGPKFDLIEGECEFDVGTHTSLGAYADLDNVTRIYPPEKPTRKVSVTINGVETQISRESALALKEALKDLS